MNIRVKNIESLFHYLNPLFPTLFSSLALHGVSASDFSNLRIRARKEAEGKCSTKIASILSGLRDRTTITSLKEIFGNVKKNVKGEVTLEEGEYEDDSEHSELLN